MHIHRKTLSVMAGALLSIISVTDHIMGGESPHLKYFSSHMVGHLNMVDPLGIRAIPCQPNAFLSNKGLTAGKDIRRSGG